MCVAWVLNDVAVRDGGAQAYTAWACIARTCPVWVCIKHDFLQRWKKLYLVPILEKSLIFSYPLLLKSFYTGTYIVKLAPELKFKDDHANTSVKGLPIDWYLLTDTTVDSCYFSWEILSSKGKDSTYSKSRFKVGTLWIYSLVRRWSASYSLLVNCALNIIPVLN